MKKVKIWDKKFNNTIMEKRIFNIENRFEKREDGQEVVVGYGSIFNSRSENLGGFYEYISPTAISEETIEKSDVRALINHDANLILARSTSGTLDLSVDEKGLKYEFEIPETSYGKDLAINMKNGNLNQSSFAFTVGSDVWSSDDDGNDIRTITSIDKLFDISVVSYPAYSQADSDLVVAQRGLAMYKEKQEIKEEETDLVARSLAKLKIELIKRTK
jgi:HK97 family phage prohead protease